MQRSRNLERFSEKTCHLCVYLRLSVFSVDLCCSLVDLFSFLLISVDVRLSVDLYWLFLLCLLSLCCPLVLLSVLTFCLHLKLWTEKRLVLINAKAMASPHLFQSMGDVSVMRFQ